MTQAEPIPRDSAITGIPPTLGPILVAVDLRDPVSNARLLREAGTLAQLLQRSLRLVHVLEPLLEEELILPVMPDLPGIRRRQAGERLGMLAREHAPEADIVVREGRAWQELIGVASEQGAALVVIGCGRDGSGVATLIGSTAERVVRHAECPVLVLRGEEGQLLEGDGPLLLCTDRSESSSAAFPHAAGLARLLAAQLLVVSVEAPLALPGTQEYQRHDSEIDAERAAADEALESFLRMHLPADVPAQSRVLEGTPHRALLRVASREQARLIIAANRGRHGWRRALIGSTTERLVRHAPCPVLVVPSTFADPDMEDNDRARPDRAG